MDRHERQSKANYIVARLLYGLVTNGMVEAALSDGDVSAEEGEAIKGEIETIAQEHEATADYHRSMGTALRRK